MLLKDVEFWYNGKPPYVVTLEDESGLPIGLVYTDGTIVLTEPSKNSRVGQEVRQQGEVAAVVWDGAMDDPAGGHSKGRLLPVKGPAYIDSLTRLKHLARADKHDKENQKRAGGDVPRKKKRNSKKGQSSAEGTK